MKELARCGGVRLVLNDPKEYPLSETAQAKLSVMIASERADRKRALEIQQQYDDFGAAIRKFRLQRGEIPWLWTISEAEKYTKEGD